MGINSYALTIADPKKLGEFVTWMHEASGYKPILPWISAESSRYNHYTLEEKKQSIREQVYSAITHIAAGIMFYPDPDTSYELWDIVLDVSKELGVFKYYLENGNLYDFNYNYNTHWRTVRIGTDYFLFAVNFGNNSESPPISKFENLTIQSGEMGVWHTNSNGSTIRKLSTPSNLGFERNITGATGLYDNWKVFQGRVRPGPSPTVSLNTIPSNLKIGSQSLKINDPSDVVRASVEQFFDIIPGGIYQIQGWYKGMIGNQRLILQFYNGGQWLEEHQVSGHATNEWELLKTPTVVAPSNANRIKIHIGSFHNSQSLGFWDDIKVNKLGFEVNNTSNKNPDNVTPKFVEAETNGKFREMFSLEPNYPNPFNPSTQISFNITEQSHVRLEIFDILGRSVNVLTNQVFSPGNHQVTWDGSKASTGVYIVQMFVTTEDGRRYNFNQNMSLIK